MGAKSRGNGHDQSFNEYLSELFYELIPKTLF
jgi:hypothetical protein